MRRCGAAAWRRGTAALQLREARSRTQPRDEDCAEDDDFVERAVVMREQCDEYVDKFEKAERDEEEDILLYDGKPLYVIAEEKDELGMMSMRDYWQMAMWGMPNNYRTNKGFLQRGRLGDMQEMLERMYGVDFALLSGSEYMEELRRLKAEPMLRPQIPSLLNPQFARTLLNYYLRQMEKLAMPRLIIYELSGGNGQTALSILDILEEEFPEIYDACEYHMIDVQGVWMTHRDAVIKANHYDHYFEHHISIFDWEVVVPERVFFVCLESLSYFPMDKIETHRVGGMAAIATLSDKQIIWERGICEREVGHWDKRKENWFWARYTRYSKRAVHKPLTCPQILQYLAINDIDGRFPASRLAQHEYDVLGSKGFTYDNHKYVFDDLQMTLIRGFGAAGDIFGQTRQAMGLNDNEFWIPTLNVPFCDRLRKFFPRHTLVVLDQSGMHTYIQGYNAPVVRQYAWGTYHEIKTELMHENSLGVTEWRQNFDFAGFRQLYYHMMQFPPEHPAHLRCTTLRCFFEDYGTEEVKKTLIHEDAGGTVDQPMDAWRGARLLITEFGSDLDVVGDTPKDAAAQTQHMRQRIYDRAMWGMEKLGLIDPESKLNLASRRDLEADLTQVIDTTPVLKALGPNPTPEQLDAPVGYHTNQAAKKACLAEAAAKAAQGKLAAATAGAHERKKVITSADAAPPTASGA